MIEIEIITNVDIWTKGHRQLVDENHWLAWSPYARVVRRDVVVDPVPAADGPTPVVGVARRRPRKKVTDVQDSAEFSGGPDGGSTGGRVSGDESGHPVASGNEEDDA